MSQTLAISPPIVISTYENESNFTIHVAGEIVGDSADSLLHVVQESALKSKNRQLKLDLGRVTYMNSYGFGIIAYLWRIIRESGRKLHILANTVIHAKFERFGFIDKVDLQIVPFSPPLPEMTQF